MNLSIMKEALMGRVQHEVALVRNAIAARSVDPDMSLITRWLCNELSPEDAAKVEERLQTDVDFYILAAPVVEAWTLPVRLGPTLEKREYERKQQPRESVFHWYTINPLKPWGARMTMIGTITTLAVCASVWAVGRSMTSPRATVTLRPPVPAVAESLRSAAERAAASDEDVVTGPKEYKDVDLRGGAHVTVRPESHLTVRYGPRVFDARLEGEMAGEIKDTTVAISVRTAAGGALISHGTFAIRCEKECVAMRITTGTARAYISGDQAFDGLKLAPFSFGRTLRQGPTEQVQSPEHWPLLDPKVRQ